MGIMYSSCLAPPEGGTSRLRLIAGLDVMATSQRAAEHQLAQVAAAARGAGASDITTATHWATVFPTPHVSMSISMLTGLSPARMLELLADLLTVEDGAPGSVSMGDRGIGLPALQISSAAAAAAHRDRTSGQVVEFPGHDTLFGEVAFADVLRTAIDRVEVPGGRLPGDGAVLVIDGMVRPRWQGGELVLHVQPVAGGTWVPSDTANISARRPATVTAI